MKRRLRISARHRAHGPTTGPEARSRRFAGGCGPRSRLSRTWRRAAAARRRIALDSAGRSWAEPEMRLEAGRRSDLRRAMRLRRRWARSKPQSSLPRVSSCRNSSRSVSGGSAGWKGAHGTALAVDPVRGAFFRRYRSKPAPRHAADVHVAYWRTAGRRADRDRKRQPVRLAARGLRRAVFALLAGHAAHRGKHPLCRAPRAALLRIQRQCRALDQSLDPARARLLFPARLSFQPARRMGAVEGRRAAADREAAGQVQA
jgi:hypothetical protein